MIENSCDRCGYACDLTSHFPLYSSSQQGVVQSVTMEITDRTSPMKQRDMMLIRYFQNGSRSVQE